MTPTPIVVSVNVGRPKPLPGKSGMSSIDKRRVDGPVAVRPLGLAGDTQSDKHNHGGVEQAVYAYGTEDLAHWGKILHRELTPGQFGENLSTRGVDVTGALIGETWRVGSTLLQVSVPRIPCVVFQNFLAEPQWVKRFTEEGRPGAYLRVLEPGQLAANDEIVIEHRPDHDVTIGLTFARSPPSAICCHACLPRTTFQKICMPPSNRRRRNSKASAQLIAVRQERSLRR